MASGVSGGSVGGSGDDGEARGGFPDVATRGDDVGSGGDDVGSVSDDLDEVESSDDDQSGVISVPVEVPQLWHSDWDSWQAYFAEYCARTMQVLPVRETMSRAERNRRLKRTKKGADDSLLVPDGCDPYQRVYICTHGWKKRKSRSEGARPKQHIRLTNCPFRFCVQWNLSRGELQVKNGHFRHNHNVSEAAFATYPGSRGVDDPLVGSRVDGMLAVGAKRSKIYDYLLDHDQNVIQVDVDNLVRKHSSSVSSADDDEATAREIAVFAASDPENASSVAANAAGESGVISLASAHMRRVYSRFSELLLVDCTHKTNRYNYQLLTFMAMNEFGEGTVVQHSLIEANGDWHMERAIAHFKRLHPSRINMLRVIMVDKDLNEIRVLESNFPDARVLICHFHVIKYLKEMRSKPEFCKISGDDASQIDAAVHKMVYAGSEDVYDAAYVALHGICDRIGFQDFFSYFERNWDTCQDRWVMYRRSNLPHFKNHTNNRLESFFGKLKDGVDSSMSMSARVKALVSHDKRVENEYKYRISRIGQFSNSSYDEEMSVVLRFTTHYVATQGEAEYCRALEKADVYHYDVDQNDTNVVTVSGKFTEHKLRVDDWRCDCPFAQSMKLPCRHSIAYRKAKKCSGNLIPLTRIDSRWTSCSGDLKRVKQFSYEIYGAGGKCGEKREVLTHSERYREALRTTQLIASEMADITDPEEFSEMVEFVLTQWRNVRQRKRTSSTFNQLDEEGAKELKETTRREFDLSLSSNEGESDPDAEEEENLTQASGIKSPLKIRLNPKARKVGAPKKKKTKKVASERKDRKWFEAAEAGRKKAGEVSLQGLMDSLDHDQPSLTETQRRLSGVVVKYSDADKKKPKFKKLKNPVLILDPFYVLPSKLLNACLAALPVANSQETAISVDASQSQTTRDSREDPKIIEVIQIKDVGNFSRSQIELFKRVENLKTCVQLGFDMHKWLTQDGIPSLPAEYHGIGSKVAEDIQASYPRKRILGLPCDHDFEYAMLYRAIPPTWLTDASIRALCLRLVTDYPACRFAGFQSATSKAKRTRKDDDVVLDKHIRDRVIAQAAEPGVDTVLLPLNFSSAHWCCVVVKVSAKRIYYYDPLNQSPYRNAARAVATHLKIAGLNDFDAIVMNNPIQFDAYSCGVYVCWMFIRQVVPRWALDMSANALTLRRFELFYYILTGHLLPFEGTHEAEDDETEEKMPAPVEVGGHKDPNEDNERKGADGGEDVPPTQVAE